MLLSDSGSVLVFCNVDEVGLDMLDSLVEGDAGSRTICASLFVVLHVGFHSLPQGM